MSNYDDNIIYGNSILNYVWTDLVTTCRLGEFPLPVTLTGCINKIELECSFSCNAAQ